MNKLKVYKCIKKKIIYDTFARHWVPSWGRHSLVVSNHPGSGLDPPIGSDQKRGATVSLPLGEEFLFPYHGPTFKG